MTYTAPVMPWMELRKARPAGELAEVDRLLAAYDGLAANARKAFMEAVERLEGQVDLQRLAQFIREGRMDAALQLIDNAAVATGMRRVTTALTRGVVESATAATARIPTPPSGMEVIFGMTNPRTTQFLRDYEFGLIRELTTEARAAVATTLRAGVNAGRNPLDIARDVKASIGLTQRQAAAAENFRALLEQGRAEALQRKLRDRRFDPTVRRAMAAGTPLTAKQVDDMVGRYRAKSLKLRSETIARTEAIRAVNAGNREAWRQAVDDGEIDAKAVRRKWVITPDKKLRDAHRAIPKLNPEGVGLDEPFQSPLGPIMYPGDPKAKAANTINCRCAQIIRYSPRSAAAGSPRPKPPVPPTPPLRSTLPAREPGFDLAGIPTAPEAVDDILTPIPNIDFGGVGVFENTNGFLEVAASQANRVVPKPRVRKPTETPEQLAARAEKLAMEVVQTVFGSTSQANYLASARSALATAPKPLQVLSAPEATLMRWYTGSGYRGMNEVLRNHKGTDKTLNPLVKKQRDAINLALARAPKTPGVHRRGYTVNDIGAELKLFQRSLDTGEPVTWNAFTSTSSATGFGGNVRVTVVGKNGVDVSPISLSRGEAEVLYAAGTRWKVLKLEVRNFGTEIHVELEEIVEQPKRTRRPKAARAPQPVSKVEAMSAADRAHMQAKMESAGRAILIANRKRRRAA